MFHTPTRPVMYIPEYNAVLVPAGGRAPEKVTEPPRRRRPLIDLIRFVQGKPPFSGTDYDDELREDGLLRSDLDKIKNSEDLHTNMSEKEQEETLNKMRELVKTGVLDNIQITNQPTSIDISIPHSRSLPNALQFGTRLYNTRPRYFPSNVDNNQWFHQYSYRYVIPQTPSTSKRRGEAAKVFFQQKISMPRQSNYRYITEEANPIKSPNSLPTLYYQSPRPEIQQRIEFNKLRPKIKNNIINLNEHKIKENVNMISNSSLVDKQQLNISLSEVKENKNVSKEIDNVVLNGVVHTNVNTSLDSHMDLIKLPQHIDVDNLKLVITSLGNSNLKESVGNVSSNNMSFGNDGKIFVGNNSGSIREEIVLMTGKKPSELVLNPIARAVAGPRGVAIAAPIARAVVRPDEDVVVQFDPEAVAIAGPGGQAHSHPQLIITFMNDTDLS